MPKKQTPPTAYADIPVCEHCGSRYCAAVGGEVCLHTRKQRKSVAAD